MANINKAGKLENMNTGMLECWNTKSKNSKASVQVLVLSGLLAFSITACSHLPDWMGEAKKDSGIKGTRVAVLSLDTTTSPDSALNEIKVTIPDSIPNISWYKSDGHSALLPSNPELSQPFSSVVTVSAGSGASDGQHLKASPIIAEGKVFTISADGRVSAFDSLKIKKQIWVTKLNLGEKSEKLSSTAGLIYYKGRIYITTGYNQVDALDAATGKIIWTKNINSIARSAPEAKDNTIFVNTSDNRLYALDESDGGIIWNHTGGLEELSMFGSASPAVYDNIVIAPYSSGEVYALQAVDGREIWSNAFARRSIGSSSSLSDIDAPPVVSNGLLFVISNDGVLASTDIKTGKRMWEQAISGRQSPWVADDFLYIITNKNELTCIHAASGGIKWVKQLRNYKHEEVKKDPITWSGPVLAGNLLWVVNSHGKLSAFSPFDGAEKYERKVPKDIYIAPVVASGNIYLYSDDAQLIQISDGNFSKYREVAKQSEVKEEKKQKLPVKQNVTAPKQSESMLQKVTSGTVNASNKLIYGVKGLFSSK